ncbi:excisionase family DNA-binding protein [Dinghuibacter silviterrae]|uniref:Excisionase family DNA binding protein n=1 Tax=Dinghuibacter silviterrae TaxID=1539049 RepID=A0A4R8DJE9_9BACT|nr:excisionase family DNA-binding protein [Dinghuibacter silviterrae]TDW97444.1 excisionase family DNA binding protein [Dinghuibacter silviterrae]
MDALIEKTTREDQRIAKGSVNLFKKLSRSLGSSKKVVEISFPESDEPLRLPAKVIAMMAEILSGMSVGRSVAVIQTEMEVSTQEAADFLEVSRPHVVRLLEKGEIPFTKAGTHRRIKISDLIAYQKTLKATRRKQLKFLAKQAQDLKLDY